jgi:hypothetical protein
MSGSDEFFYRENGKKQDADLHNAILSNPEADKANKMETARRAVEDGMSPKIAAKLYGVNKADVRV